MFIKAHHKIFFIIGSRFSIIDNKIEVFSVTRLYTYATSFLQDRRQNILYLTAERSEDGTRTFQIVPGQPFQTAIVDVNFLSKP
ncbi:MAG TPA: hypothetical protein DEP42_02855 [Ruminococcaceae bacterium]|nr:hypothetical protein [Oscillospiraceae bacterium]